MSLMKDGWVTFHNVLIMTANEAGKWKAQARLSPTDNHQQFNRLPLPTIYSRNTSAYYLGRTFINREWTALLESKFHFQVEYCSVPTVALFQIWNADWIIIDIRRMFTCK